MLEMHEEELFLHMIVTFAPPTCAYATVSKLTAHADVHFGICCCFHSAGDINHIPFLQVLRFEPRTSQGASIESLDLTPITNVTLLVQANMEQCYMLALTLV